MSHGGCTNCGNTSSTSGCQGCGNCEPCDPCSPQDSDLACQARQIEQLANRTDQLKVQVESLNPGAPFEPLCEVQECDSPDCANTGRSCENGSPTGRPVGAQSGNSCCGEANPANMQDALDILNRKLRLLTNRVTKNELDVKKIRRDAVQCILLDAQGNVRGWLTLNGDIKNANPGTWELAATA